MDLNGFFSQFGGVAWTLVFFVIALSIIVTIHELGHYLVGRWTGIDAEVFSIGFGPALLAGTDRRGTRWQLAALPFGGYVKFVGDANAASAPDPDALAQMDPATRRRSVHGAPLWARAATVAAGPIFNFILAVLIFAGMSAWDGRATYPITVASVQSVPGEESGAGLRPGDVILAIAGEDVATREALVAVLDKLPDTPTLTYSIERGGQRIEVEAPHMSLPLVGSVSMRSAAQDAGLKAGDVILSVNGAPLATFGQLVDITANSNGAPLALQVWRAGTVSEFTLVPRMTELPNAEGGFDSDYKIGLGSSSLISSQTSFPGVGTALQDGASQTWRVVTTTFSAIRHMVTGQISVCNIQGPIGIARTSGWAAASGLDWYISFLAFLSAAVGLMNLMPVPVLDGGHLVFHAYEAVFRRPPSDRAMQLLMTIGLVLIGALMIFGLTNDLRC